MKTVVSRSALVAFPLAVTVLSSQHLLMAQSTTNSATTTQSPSPATDASKGPQLEEILVTARARTHGAAAETADGGLAVVTSEAIEKTGAITLEDLGREVPGLSIVSAAPGQNIITLRGLSGNNTVGFYLDDTPLSVGIGNAVQPTNFDMDPALFDLDRVEVLRGPQGTLYGASSFGGTVRYITNQPNLNDPHVTAKTTLSDTDGGGFNQEIDALLNQPLIPGIVAVRAMAFERVYSGVYRSLSDRSEQLSRRSARSRRAQRQQRSTPALGGALPSRPSPPTPSLRPWQPIISAWTSAVSLRSIPRRSSFDDPIQSRRGARAPLTDRVSLYTLTLQGDVQPVHLTSSTSYLDRYVFDAEDDSKSLDYFFPQPEVYPSTLYAEAGNHDFVEEVRGSGSAGPVHAVAGLFYAHAVSYGTPQLADDFPVRAHFGNEAVYYNWNDFLDVQKAAFAELNIDLARGLQATLGDRIYRQSQRYGVYINGVLNGGETPASYSSSEVRGSTPKYGLSYHVSPDIMTYATVSKGYREGGPLFPFPTLCDSDLANLGLTKPPTAYKPDSIWNYELGAKTQWLDHRLTVNGAVYYIDWSNIQQTITLPTCSFVFTGNFGTASSKGTEFEMNYDPTAALKLSLSVSYNEAKLTSTIAGAQGQTGQTLEYAPRWMGAVSAEYTRDITADTSAFLRGDFNTTSHQYSNFDTTSIYRDIGGYSLLNLRLGVKHNAWRGALFVSNALDKHAETELPIANGIDIPTQRTIALNRPRTIGLDIRFDY